MCWSATASVAMVVVTALRDFAVIRFSRFADAALLWVYGDFFAAVQQKSWKRPFILACKTEIISDRSPRPCPMSSKQMLWTSF